MIRDPYHVKIFGTAPGGHEPVGTLRREEDSPLIVTGAESLFIALDDAVNPARVGELSDTVWPRETELA